MNRLVKSGRTDLSLTLVELCSLSAFVCAGMNVPRTCVCTWAPILTILFLMSPTFSLKQWQSCLCFKDVYNSFNSRLVYYPKCTILAPHLAIKAP